MSDDSLGDRQKRYEDIPRINLMPKVPVIIRVDGRAFHTVLSKCNKPLDERVVECMKATATALCEQIAGARIAYFQSDEISVLLTDYQTRETDAWFDYGLQKMVSISAAIATVAFNQAAAKYSDWPHSKPALFDSRAWNLPIHEVVNYYIWRQQDATRNSISSLAQAHFSHKSLHGVNTSGMHEMLFSQKGINWNDCPAFQKRGGCIVRYEYDHQGLNPKTNEKTTSRRSGWKFDDNIPVFTQDRAYIQRLVDPPVTDSAV